MVDAEKERTGFLCGDGDMSHRHGARESNAEVSMANREREAEGETENQGYSMMKKE